MCNCFEFDCHFRCGAWRVDHPSWRNLPPRTRIVIEFLAELIRADSQ